MISALGRARTPYARVICFLNCALFVLLCVLCWLVLMLNVAVVVFCEEQRILSLWCVRFLIFLNFFLFSLFEKLHSISVVCSRRPNELCKYVSHGDRIVDGQLNLVCHTNIMLTDSHTYVSHICIYFLNEIKFVFSIFLPLLLLTLEVLSEFGV